MSEPRPTARSRNKHDAITAAAIEVFAERGFHQSRVSDIARKAGVADGTIYLYFKNKEEILLSVFESKMDELHAGMVAALDGVTDPRDRIRTFARLHFQMMSAHPQMAEVLQVELRLSHKFMRDYRPEKLWRYLQLFRDMIRAGVASGLFAADTDEFVTMWAFFGSLDEIAMQWALARHKERFHLDRAADQVASLFIAGLQAPARPSLEKPQEAP